MTRHFQSDSDDAAVAGDRGKRPRLWLIRGAIVGAIASTLVPIGVAVFTLWIATHETSTIPGADTRGVTFVIVYICAFATPLFALVGGLLGCGIGHGLARLAAADALVQQAAAEIAASAVVGIGIGIVVLIKDSSGGHHGTWLTYAWGIAFLMCSATILVSRRSHAVVMSQACSLTWIPLGMAFIAFAGGNLIPDDTALLLMISSVFTLLALGRLLLFRTICDASRCSKCGYSRRGLPSAKCPECGVENSDAPYRALMWRWTTSE